MSVALGGVVVVPPVAGGAVPPVAGGAVPPVAGGVVPPVAGGVVPPVTGGGAPVFRVLASVPPLSCQNFLTAAYPPYGAVSASDNPVVMPLRMSAVAVAMFNPPVAGAGACPVSCAIRTALGSFWS